MTKPFPFRCTILYVEDDADDVLLFEHSLKRAKIACEVQNVSSLVDAEAYLSGLGPYSDRERFPLPHLIITDLAFRGASGFDFISWLRSQAGLKSIPVICVTGSDDPRKLQQARGFGVSCVGKTSLFREAVEVVQHILAASPRSLAV